MENKFITLSKQIYNNKYDYSLVEYKNAKTKVKIICPEHGIFEQRIVHHLNGRNGCDKCNNHHTKSIEEFIKLSNKIHNYKYDYSLVSEYKNNRTKVKIICPIHGVFEQSSTNHINRKQGCPKCVGKYKQTNDFILESKFINGNKYDYSLVEYKNNRTKVKIICPVHGIFEQSPNNHLSKKQGCPKCNVSHGEKKIQLFLENNNINYNYQKKFNDCKYKRMLPFDFYLPDYNMCIEFDGEQHFEMVNYFGGFKKFEERKKYDLMNYTQTKDMCSTFHRLLQRERLTVFLF